MPDGHPLVPDATDRGFLAGVIEGFYGPPWSVSERLELFDWMAGFGLNTYLYAPKDDLKHRTLWRELYAPAEAESLRALIRACGTRGLRFIFALSPGLDIRFSGEADRDCLHARFEQMLALGCEHFALLFDDIPDRMHADDGKRWPSFASAQCDATNAVFRWLRERRPGARFLFCPTPYCGRMAERQAGGPGYLDTVGRELDAGIDVCWTGPEIVSREITVAHVQGVRRILRRKPLIWDNLHANDYDGRRFYCGPYAGRPGTLRQEVAGILSNPNNELPLNYVPLRTLGGFLRGNGPWDARQAYIEAMGAWLPRFETHGPAMALDDVILLGDCYYLPHEEGPEAAALLESGRRLLASDPAAWGAAAAAFRQQAGRLRDVCARVAELRDRPLFYALGRRTWELREEMDLLLAWVRSKEADPEAPCRSDFHLPGTYRGGMVERLQRLLAQREDGAFQPAGDAGSGRSGAVPGATA
jgi:protein O-GlcNAcase/histone acetyltransferase